MSFRKKVFFPALFLFLAWPAVGAHSHSNDPHTGEGGEITSSHRTGSDYEPPAPGSYRLPVIQQGADGIVLDADGRRHRLSDLMADRYVLLSFIYTGCYDPKGCPLAIHTLDFVREELEKDPAADSGNVLLLTLSFDPENDTPSVMRKFAEAHGFTEGRKRREWLFLTTSSKDRLRPILDGYGQYVVREYDKSGRPTGGFSHILKVFLIDPDRNVRNIYSTSFLNPDLIVNDIKTLMMEGTKVHRDVP